MSESEKKEMITSSLLSNALSNTKNPFASESMDDHWMMTYSR